MNGAALARQVRDRIALRVRIGSVGGSHTFCLQTGCFVASMFCGRFPAFGQVHELELLERAIPAEPTPLWYSTHIARTRFRLGEQGRSEGSSKLLAAQNVQCVLRVPLKNVQGGKCRRQRAQPPCWSIRCWTREVRCATLWAGSVTERVWFWDECQLVAQICLRLGTDRRTTC